MGYSPKMTKPDRCVAVRTSITRRVDCEYILNMIPNFTSLSSRPEKKKGLTASKQFPFHSSHFNWVWRKWVNIAKSYRSRRIYHKFKRFVSLWPSPAVANLLHNMFLYSGSNLCRFCFIFWITRNGNKLQRLVACHVSRAVLNPPSIQ
jgi:hypothetical protein